MNHKINLKETALGIELGSTRIKAVLIDETFKVLSIGAHDWENRFENGYFTYHLDDVWHGIQDAVAKMMANFEKEYGTKFTNTGAIGVSAMMHGYLAFDKEKNQLAEFRTWRNTTTAQASEILTKEFNFNIPHRWSIAHLYQAILNNEEHVTKVDSINTLAGYVHEKLTGKRVLGVGDASGMFPIDSKTCDYDKEMMEKFNVILSKSNLTYNIENLLPKVLKAGEDAGTLTAEGAKLLDPTGTLQSGALMCPPEGDAGTGMVATNSVKVCTGNVSAGTSIFAMIVLKDKLSKVYPEIDMVTTPTGDAVAMVHCNTCTSDLDAWVNLFYQVQTDCGGTLTKGQVYDLFYDKALKADPDCGGLISFNYYSGEPITKTEAGCPLLLRPATSKLSFENLARVQLYSTIATLKLGMDILLKQEKVELKTLTGHGGLFKTKTASQPIMASALNVPVMVQETAGEGGPWGVAVLAMYRKNKEPNETLDAYLDNKVFKDETGSVSEPDQEINAGFNKFMERYVKCIPVEKLASEALS
ncbi:MAG: xylulokinase [Massiliimalia sp.]|jgi:sugar (pentulose or hexulose) kinase